MRVWLKCITQMNRLSALWQSGTDLPSFEVDIGQLKKELCTEVSAAFLHEELPTLCWQ